MNLGVIWSFFVINQVTFFRGLLVSGIFEIASSLLWRSPLVTAHQVIVEFALRELFHWRLRRELFLGFLLWDLGCARLAVERLLRRGYLVGLGELVDEIFGGRASKSASGNSLWEGLCHEWVCQDFLKCGSFWRIKNKYLTNEISSIFRDSNMLRECIGTGFDLLVGWLDFWGLKGWLSDELCVANLFDDYIMTPTDQTSTS